VPAAAGGIEDIYPLAPIQEGVLFDSLYARDPEVYVVQLVYELRGPLVVPALREAWRRTVARHPLLRTEFEWEDVDEPVQLVRRSVDVPLPVQAVEEPAVAELLAAERRPGFDLARAPLMRLLLLRLAEDIHRLVWTHHLLIVDGWSVALVLAEVFEQYAAVLDRRRADLPAAPRYRNHVARVRAVDPAEEAAWWRARLAGVGAPTPLPAADPAAPLVAGTAERALAPAVASALQAFAREHRLTVASIAQGAWALLLARHGGVDDVVFGVTSSGRSAGVPGVEAVVGPFIVTLPLRVRIRRDAPAAPWLAAVQAAQAELREHETSRLVEIQRASDVPAGRRLFDTAVVVENYPDAHGGGGGGLEVRKVQATERTSIPLLASVALGRGVVLRLAADGVGYGAAALDGLLDHWATLLQALVELPARSVGTLPMLSPAQRRRLREASGADAAVGIDTTLPEAFRRQAARTPSAVAVVDGEDHITFAELDARSDRLARHLAALGVIPEDVVALALERSIDLVAAMLAAMKAGAAYLPLDVGYPDLRNTYVGRDAAVRLVVTRRAHLDRAGAPSTPRLLLDDDHGAAGPRPEGALPAAVHPDQAAFVLYTSGSTGRPKGVACSHRSVMNTIRWMERAFPFGTRDRLAHRTSVGFGDAVHEVFWPLLGGRPTVIVSDAATRDPFALTGTLARHSVTRLFSVPSLLDALLDAVDGLGRQVPTLRMVLLSGEAVTPELARRFLAAVPGAALVNVYGATETTCDAVWHTIGPEEPPPDTVPIGRPLPNLRARVLDRWLAEVPDGAVGDLYIGGLGLAHGYVNAPAATAAVFVPDPYADRPGARLYRTGDRASRSADGRLHYHGRADAQVKIRGVRIEPAEVERALAEHPAVTQAAVVAPPGPERLVAAVVWRDGAAPSAAVLRSFLAERLPPQMVPAAFVAMEALPVMPSGKVNRVRLAADLADVRADVVPSAPPRTAIEATLSALWASVLGVDRVGIDDSFFDLGGESLLAMRLLARVRERFGVDVALRELFDAPTVAAQARAVIAAEGLGTPVRAVVPAPAGTTYPLSCGQEDMWRVDRALPNAPFFTIPVVSRIAGPLDVDGLAESFRALVRRHASLRTVFVEGDDGVPVQVVRDDATVPFVLADLEADLAPLSPVERDVALELLAEGEAVRPFDLSTGPLVRATVVRVDADDHLLLVSVHHMVADAWSLEVLFREWAALRAGEPLAPLSVQYADFAYWQRRWLAAGAFDEEIGYWRRRLAGPLPPLELPVDHRTDARTTFDVARANRTLPAALWEDVCDLARRERATPFMVLLAAFDALLGLVSGQRDVRVGTIVANRGWPGCEGVVGLFVNTVLLRADVDPSTSFLSLLRAVRDDTLAAYANQQAPFEVVLDEARGGRGLRRSDVYSVMALWEDDAPAPPLAGIGAADPGPGEGGDELLATGLDVVLIAKRRRGEVICSLRYRRDRFEPGTAEWLASGLIAVLGGGVAEPERRLSSIVLPARPVLQPQGESA
jgi:amino acid adenylation domain-containing protein